MWLNGIEIQADPGFRKSSLLLHLWQLQTCKGNSSAMAFDLNAIHMQAKIFGKVVIVY
jgi:hypothetical protein